MTWPQLLLWSSFNLFSDVQRDCLLTVHMTDFGASRCVVQKRRSVCIQETWGQCPPAMHQPGLLRLLPHQLDLLQGGPGAVQPRGHWGAGWSGFRQIQPHVHHSQLLRPAPWAEGGRRRLLCLPARCGHHDRCLPLSSHHHCPFQSQWPATRRDARPQLHPLHLLWCWQLQVILQHVQPQLGQWRRFCAAQRHQVSGLSQFWMDWFNTKLTVEEQKKVSIEGTWTIIITYHFTITVSQNSNCNRNEYLTRSKMTLCKNVTKST